VIDSTTEEVFATIPAGVPADIDRAVAARKPRSTAGSRSPHPSER
jgi:acyl-CoA reductase-like NAD-dependent aldehyde dehydrogenase